MTKEEIWYLDADENFLNHLTENFKTKEFACKDGSKEVLLSLKLLKVSSDF